MTKAMKVMGLKTRSLNAGCTNRDIHIEIVKSIDKLNSLG